MNGNKATGNGGAIHFTTGSVGLIENSVVWGNQDTSGTGTASASLNPIASTVTISTSLVQGSGGSGGSWVGSLGSDGGGNLDQDPLFTAGISPSAAPTSTANLFLSSSSPAIDTANSTSCATADIRNMSRPQLNGCDMGLFERTQQITATMSLTNNQAALYATWMGVGHES